MRGVVKLTNRRLARIWIKAAMDHVETAEAEFLQGDMLGTMALNIKHQLRDLVRLLSKEKD